jgi:hypothetical protein
MAKTAEEIKAQLRAQREVEAKKDLSTVPALAESYASAEALKDSEAREKRIKSAPCAESDATDARGRVQSFSALEGNDASCSATGPITLQPKGAAQNRPRVTARAGKDMPHSIDAEKGILCAILQRPAAVLPIAQQSLGSDHFHLPQHCALFEHACNYFNDEGGFDMVTLMTHLLDTGHIKDVGGPGYLNEVFTFGAIPENAAQYIEILNDKYGARRIIKLADDIRQQAYDVGESAIGGPADILDELYLGLDQVRSGLRSNLRLPELRDVSFFLGQNQPPEPPELVKGLLHQGSKGVVGGSSKGRKTMTLIDLGASVAAGVPWWGFPCVQGPVCYINFEIQEPFMCKRVNAVCAAKGVTLPPGQFMVWNLRGHGEGIENLVADLMAVLRHRKFALIIIDPIYKALGDRDENKAGDVASMLNQLEKIAVKTGAAVAFGAHYSKGNQALKESIDRIGGSGVFARDPDSILTMTAHEEPEAFTVEATLRNFAPIKPFVIRWEWPLFYRDDALDPANLKRSKTKVGRPADASESAEELLDLLEEHGLRYGEFKRRAETELQIKEKTFEKYFTILKRTNRIEKIAGAWNKTATL